MLQNPFRRAVVALIALGVVSLIVATSCSFDTGTEQRRYDNVRIVRPDGTVIARGHEAVKAYFEQERKLHETYGSSLIFQVYRVNLHANTLRELQGERLAEITVEGGFASGDATVADVKKKIFLVLEQEEARLSREGKHNTPLKVKQGDRITFFFAGRPMEDHTLFYADNFILLPAWIQVLLHDGEPREVIERIEKLANSGQR